jgi:hypothetical protein
LLADAQRLENKAANWGRASSVFDAGLKVVTLPYTLPVRAAALGVRGVVAPASRLAEFAGNAAKGRALAAAITGRPSATRWTGAATALDGMSLTFARAAETARAIGLAGMAAGRQQQAYNRLGVKPWVSLDEVKAAHSEKTGAQEGKRPSNVRDVRLDALDDAYRTVYRSRGLDKVRVTQSKPRVQGPDAPIQAKGEKLEAAKAELEQVRKDYEQTVDALEQAGKDAAGSTSVNGVKQTRRALEAKGHEQLNRMQELLDKIDPLGDGGTRPDRTVHGERPGTPNVHEAPAPTKGAPGTKDKSWTKEQGNTGNTQGLTREWVENQRTQVGSAWNRGHSTAKEPSFEKSGPTAPASNWAKVKDWARQKLVTALAAVMIMSRVLAPEPAVGELRNDVSIVQVEKPTTGSLGELGGKNKPGAPLDSVGSTEKAKTSSPADKDPWYVDRPRRSRCRSSTSGSSGSSRAAPEAGPTPATSGWSAPTPSRNSRRNVRTRSAGSSGPGWARRSVEPRRPMLVPPGRRRSGNPSPSAI